LPYDLLSLHYPFRYVFSALSVLLSASALCSPVTDQRYTVYAHTIYLFVHYTSPTKLRSTDLVQIIQHLPSALCLCFHYSLLCFLLPIIPTFALCGFSSCLLPALLLYCICPTNLSHCYRAQGRGPRSRCRMQSTSSIWRS
jgi:hypothetical protein